MKARAPRGGRWETHIVEFARALTPDTHLSVTLYWLVDMLLPLSGENVVGTALRKYWWSAPGGRERCSLSSGLTEPGNPSPNASLLIVCVRLMFAECT